MLLNISLFCFGLFLLYLGAEFLVRGSSRLAQMLHIRPLIIGVTVIAFGTSSPEMLVSFVAAWSGEIDVSIGNIVGSNIANIGLILGLSCLLRPLKLKKNLGYREIVWMLFATILFWFFCFNGYVSYYEGLLLLLGILLFLLYLVRSVISDRNIAYEPEEVLEETERFKKISKEVRILFYSVQIIIGIALLVFGSKVTINSAIYIANKIGVSEVIIGLSLVAFGTSLPELATAIVAVVQKEKAILIGNIVGSNIFNILFVGGSVASCFRIPVSDRIIFFDIPAMLIISIALGLIIFVFKKISRITGLLLLIYYVCYIIYIYNA